MRQVFTLLAALGLTTGGGVIAYIEQEAGFSGPIINPESGKLYVQRIDSSAEPIGTPTNLGGIGVRSVGLAALPGGAFCAVWPSGRSDGISTLIASRVMNAAGERGPLRYTRVALNTVEESWSAKTGIRAASAEDGRVVVVIGGTQGAGADRVRAVKALTLDATGLAVGDPITLWSVKDPTGTLTPPATWGLVRQSATSFVAAWRGGGADANAAQACRMRLI